MQKKGLLKVVGILFIIWSAANLLSVLGITSCAGIAGGALFGSVAAGLALGTIFQISSVVCYGFMLVAGVAVTRFTGNDSPSGHPTDPQVAAAPTPRPPVAEGTPGPTLERAGLDVGFSDDEAGAVAAAMEPRVMAAGTESLSPMRQCSPSSAASTTRVVITA